MLQEKMHEQTSNPQLAIISRRSKVVFLFYCEFNKATKSNFSNQFCPKVLYFISWNNFV